MGEGFQYLDSIILALVAAFIIFRLRSVLGRRTGHERPPPEATAGQSPDDNVINLPDRQGEPQAPALDPAFSEGPAAQGLMQILVADRSFDPKGFLEGARAAYEMIVSAFASGDTKTLRSLLSEDVYEDFEGAIRQREQAKQTLERTLVGIKGADVVEARLHGRMAEVTVKFVSDVLNVLRDATGAVVEGDSSKVREVTDIWTFSRNTRSRDPNWTLIETRSG